MMNIHKPDANGLAASVNSLTKHRSVWLQWGRLSRSDRSDRSNWSGDRSVVARCPDRWMLMERKRETMPNSDTPIPAAHKPIPGVCEPDNLLPLVYDELRGIAAQFMKRERSGHTLQPTALVHEAYLRLAEQTRAVWKNKGQFYQIAAQAMRRILVNHAVARKRIKRGKGQVAVPLDEGLVAIEGQTIDILALDEALSQLAEFDAQKARVVELRFFAGLTNDETAETLSLSESTVKREWRMARIWLHSRLDGVRTTGSSSGPGTESK